MKNRILKACIVYYVLLMAVPLAVSMARPVWAQAAPEKLIEQATIKKNRINITINRAFKKAYLTDDFFVEYDKDIDLTKLDYSIVTLPFIMNVISLVWISGKEYTIKSMDKEIYESLERIKKLFHVLYPHTKWNGRLIPKKLVRNAMVHRTAATRGMTALLFSGGVDSIAASYALRDKKQLLITAWGQSGLPLEDKRLWRTIKNRMITFAEEYGHENTFIKSNYYSFLDLSKLSKLSPEIVTWRIDTIEDIGWAGLTAPILLTRGIPTLHIASSEIWKQAYATAANPYIDGNITFAGIRIKHDQYDMNRCDKIDSLIQLSNRHLISRPKLIVCQKRGLIINCGSCEKCCITTLALLVLGADIRDYGFSITPNKALKNARIFIDTGKISAFFVAECTNLQEKIRTMKYPPADFSWFTRIDFSKKKAYDVELAELIDWTLLHDIFPHIKTPINQEQKSLP